jgi:hypothetical protein
VLVNARKQNFAGHGHGQTSAACTKRAFSGKTWGKLPVSERHCASVIGCHRYSPMKHACMFVLRRLIDWNVMITSSHPISHCQSRCISIAFPRRLIDLPIIHTIIDRAIAVN